MRRVMRLYRIEKINEALIEEELAVLQAQKEALEQKLSEERVISGDFTVNRDYVKRVLANFKEAFQHASLLKRRSLLREAIEEIVVGPKEGTRRYWQRRVAVVSDVSSLMRDFLASPAGFEPALPP
jgi:DNA gyrase/topoisomerase IV subunit A